MLDRCRAFRLGLCKRSLRILVPRPIPTEARRSQAGPIPRNGSRNPILWPREPLGWERSLRRSTESTRRTIDDAVPTTAALCREIPLPLLSLTPQQSRCWVSLNPFGLIVTAGAKVNETDRVSCSGIGSFCFEFGFPSADRGPQVRLGRSLFLVSAKSYIEFLFDAPRIGVY